jgi:pimeloyl-ACP methyl ester carboxylesterase
MSDSTAIPERTPGRLSRPSEHAIAYHKSPGSAPGIVFLGGFMSDMNGGKALALEAYARRCGRAFLRFDYLGHGESTGLFQDGTIGGWAEDAIAALDALTEGPQVLVGSSMGGWIMLLAALARPGRVAGLIGIAAAPDFTQDLMWDRYPEAVREILRHEGVYREASDYGDEPAIITMKLIEDGRRRLLLRGPIALDCPVRLIHGLVDPDVPWRVSVKLAERLASEDVEVILVKGGGHRLSEPKDLERLELTLERLLTRLG